MKLDRLSLLLALVAGTMQIFTHRQMMPATEVVFLLFLVQVTRSLNRASFVRPAPSRAITGAAMLTTIPDRLRQA